MAKLLFTVLVVLALATTALAADVDADVETEIPTRKPRAGKKTVPVKTKGRSFGNQKVVIVPKGDPRARPGAGEVVAPEPVKPAKAPREIVEADVVETTPVVVPPTPDFVNGLPANTAVGAGRPLLKSPAPAGADTCLRSYNGAAAAAKGAEYQANYKARGVKYSQPNRQFGITAKFADCSSFVTSILADTGFNCLFNAGRYTAYMNEQIRLRGGYSQTAKLGDIVMWGSHTGLIVKVCSPTTYTMVAMGNSGAGRAECKTVDGLKGWGSGGWLGFWTPRAAGAAPAPVLRSGAPTPVQPPRRLMAGAPASGPGACLANYNGAAVGAKGASYQATYKSRGVKYSQPNRQFGINAKFADCSSFVTSILADTGFNCLFAAGRYTAYMNQQIRPRGGYKQTAKVGDIVMWGSHTGLIVRVCSPTTFSMVAMGNSGAGRAECKTVAQLKAWGSGGWLGFWTPRP